jgi:hypothetical protein
MTVDEIINYKTSNLIKVYKLNQLGLSNQQVSDAMKPLFTTTKGVRNDTWVKYILSMFEEDPNMIKKANKIKD